MATYARPGVYVQETLNPIQPIVGPSSNTVAAFVGANDRGPTTPILVTSWSQYVNLFGSWNTLQNNNLPLALYMYFSNGGNQAYVTRVASAGATATVTAAAASSGTITYTATNTFIAGQTVTITGLTTAAFNLSNANIATATGSNFTVTSPATGTAVSGASATASVAGNAFRIFNDTATTPLPTLKIKAINPGSWGNNLNISTTSGSTTGYFNVVVYYGGSTSGNIVEQWTDVTMVSTDSRYAVSVINNNSIWISAVDLASATAAPANNPAIVSNQPLSAGLDGAAVTGTALVSALSLYDTIRQSLIINIPGYTDAATVNGAIAYAVGATRPNDAFVVIDGVNDTASNQLVLSASYTQTSYAAVYYPQLTIADPTVGVGAAAGSVKTVGAGAAVVGLYAATDASRGVFKAPAGLQARLAGVVSVPSLSMADLDSLNSAAAAVNAIRYISGSGIVVFGARTLKPGYVDRYVPVRRSLIYLEKSLRDLTHFAVFEPNDQRLWSRIEASVSSFLTSYWSQGGLSGTSPQNAYFVKCDSDNNPQASIDNGIVNIQVGVALQRPAEFVVINIGQYSGGTTVTVS